MLKASNKAFLLQRAHPQQLMKCHLHPAPWPPMCKVCKKACQLLRAHQQPSLSRHLPQDPVDADAQGLQESVPTPASPTAVKPAILTDIEGTNETSPSSIFVPSSSTSTPSTTTENPNVVTMQTATETVKEFSGTTERASPPDTTVATQTLPTVHLPRKPHVTPVLHHKRPLFPVRPPSFAPSVGHRRLRPSDRVSADGNQVQPTTTTAPATNPDINSANIPPTNENEQPSHPVVETPNIHLRRPHFPRPISANRHATSSGKAPGRASGRRRKPGRRGGKRRTTTTPPPQDITTAAPVFLEDTNAGTSGMAEFGARIGARVSQSSHQLVPMTEQPPTTSEPQTTGREFNRPAKPRRTKRPKTRPVTRPPGTEYNDVRYAYRAPGFVSTRVAVDKETAYETTHEAYITDVAPASTTYRTKSPLVAEVTLPSTESADRSAVSSVEYDEPVNDEPESSDTEEPGEEESLLPHNIAAQSESFEGQRLRNHQDKAPQPTRAAVAPKKPNAASETLLQIPQTPRPARVQVQKGTVSAPVPAAKRPSLLPSYAPQLQQPGIVRQIILSPATGPIPYQPQSVVPASQQPTQQGTQGVYKVSTYVPVASASLPGRPGLTATSYVPTTPDGQVLKVTSVAKPVTSTVNQASQNGVRRAVVSTASSPGVSGKQQSVSPAAAAPPSTAVPAGGAQVQGGSAANVVLPQGLVQSPQQQVVQVTSYTPQGSPQFQQARPTYVQQVPAQQAYVRGQQPGLGLQVPVLYAAAPLPSGQVQYHPSAAGFLRQYSPQQFQAVYAVPQNVRASAASALRTSQPVYVARGNSGVQAAVSGTGKAQGYAPIVYARPPVTLIERRPYYAFQQPVYVAASPQQPAQGAPTLTGAGNQLQQPLTLSVG
ncbi:hypothetical protein MTO96_017797 [Rhipicephalus appendiculatus]